MWRDCVEGRVVDDDWQNADDAVTERLRVVQQSVMYEGALPWRQLYTIVASLYSKWKADEIFLAFVLQLAFVQCAQTKRDAMLGQEPISAVDWMSISHYHLIPNSFYNHD